MNIKTITTSALNQAYEVSGPKKGRSLDAASRVARFAANLGQSHPSPSRCRVQGNRTLSARLRSKSIPKIAFLTKGPSRTGQAVAYGQDMIDLADRLGLKRFHFIGHDWGARAGYALAALFPHRVKSLVAISVPFEPGKAKPPAYPQARAFWYQWLLCSKPGEELFRGDPVAYGRAQWDAWSPAGWYDEQDFQKAADSWSGKDFQDVVLHAYRSRWGHAAQDPRYAKLQNRLEATKVLHIPTVLLHGVEDACELLETTEGAARHFEKDYRRVLLEGVGHFPAREKPAQTAGVILEHLRHNPS